MTFIPYRLIFVILREVSKEAMARLGVHIRKQNHGGGNGWNSPLPKKSRAMFQFREGIEVLAKVTREESKREEDYGGKGKPLHGLVLEGGDLIEDEINHVID
jgi:hypothetical protein